MSGRAALQVSLIVVLALSLFISAVYGKVGFGVSKYDVDVEIPLGSVETFDAARIYNTGNETLILNASVNQIYFLAVGYRCVYRVGNGTLSVRLILEEIELKPDEDCLIKLEVDASNRTGSLKLGNYTVQVEVIRVAIPNYSAGRKDHRFRIEVVLSRRESWC